MRLFLYDRFLEQLITLPKQTQSKVLDFQRKFRENSRSAAIHLEPIKTFRDQSFRTARIDDKYRAIVRVPESGEDYFLVWVDNHDEAMDWAKNRIFQWNEHTQSVQIFTAPETALAISTPTVAIAATTAKLFDAYTDEQLIAIGVPDITLKSVRNLVAFDDLEHIEKILPNDAYENLFYLADGANIDLLIHEIKAGKAKEEDQLLSSNNKRSFVEIKDDDGLLEEYINGDLRKWQIFLHPSQRHLVENSFSGSIKVTGGGGTGKTVAALHRLKFLTENAWTSQSKPVLFTTFTRALTTNLDKITRQMGIKTDRFKLSNIDAVARTFGEQFNIITKDSRILDMGSSKTSLSLWEEILEMNVSEFDEKFLASEYQDVVLLYNILDADSYYKQSRLGRGKMLSRKQRIQVWLMVEKYITKKKEEKWLDRAELFNVLANHCNSANIRPFDFIIADEIQDFSNTELRFLRALVEQKVNDLFLVGDPYQKIYERKVNFSAVGINIRGTKSKRLRVNYRTTEEIKRLAVSIVKGQHYDDFDGEAEKLDGYISLMHGQTPTYVLAENSQAEIIQIREFITHCVSQRFNYNDIAVACRLKEDIKEIKTYFHNNHIPYYDITSETGDANGVVLSTFHSLKGLEYKAVVLTNVNNRTFPLLPNGFAQWEEAKQQQHLSAERALLYVAITRAIQKLLLIGSGKPSDWLKVTN